MYLIRKTKLWARVYEPTDFLRPWGRYPKWKIRFNTVHPCIHRRYITLELNRHAGKLEKELQAVSSRAVNAVHLAFKQKHQNHLFHKKSVNFSLLITARSIWTRYRCSLTSPTLPPQPRPPFPAHLKISYAPPIYKNPSYQFLCANRRLFC